MKVYNKVKASIIVLLLTISLPVLAMSLQQAMSALGSAKEQGMVGEMPNGYLGVVKGSAEAQEIVKLINAARKAEYSKLAQNNNISITDVEAIAGKKALERTQPGHYIQVEGAWRTKP